MVIKNDSNRRTFYPPRVQGLHHNVDNTNESAQVDQIRYKRTARY